MAANPEETLRQLAAEGLLRGQRPLDSPTGTRITREGRTLWNFASNDYLGLARHPEIEAALIEGVERYGAGAAASRLVCGTLPPHRLLENAIARAKQAEAALTFSSGFATALGAIPAIVGKNDFVILDKLSHACLVDGARLSGATLRIFPHNDLAKLERLLASCREKSASARVLVVTESVFSMDGDVCPLREIVELTESHGALLLLDEAHAFGVLGENGMGLAEQENLQHRIAFQMGTLSKAAGLSGGYLAASRAWIDLLANRARSFVYTTAPPPALAHAAIRSLELIVSDEGKSLRAKLRANISRLSQGNTPIVPKILGTNEAVLAAAAALEGAGFLVPAIRYPTVPRGTARLRISLSAAHAPETIDALAAGLAGIR
ncbi:8-amino-7-oxononanoate synthase [Luteolibacter yonseiensis]|uniref:8-amino-7-oxononanoate synthase n=1 Tax=Luteolibacter yonseiensis TaxID=1144680 RepID=A0A934R2F2_9BACT|nr:8-amino-7-oxononanoate synthase [Luteolibacter yonseiensis]MBK1817158.1 8-amino-7-oxononanoate synthase [Luteolibacter yonseiensis]